ncbi:MAG: hypothetical protein ACFCU2_11795 [Acidimicrobiia bacterium]
MFDFDLAVVSLLPYLAVADDRSDTAKPFLVTNSSPKASSCPLIVVSQV